MPCLRGITTREVASLQYEDSVDQFSLPCPKYENVRAACGPEMCPGKPVETPTVELDFQTTNRQANNDDKGDNNPPTYTSTDHLVSKGTFNGHGQGTALVASLHPSQRMTVNITHPDPNAKISYIVYQMGHNEIANNIRNMSRRLWQCRHPFGDHVPKFPTNAETRNIFISACVLLPAKDGEKQRGAWSLTNITMTQTLPPPVLLLRNGTTCPLLPNGELVLDALIDVSFFGVKPVGLGELQLEYTGEEQVGLDRTIVATRLTKEEPKCAGSNRWRTGCKVIYSLQRHPDKDLKSPDFPSPLVGFECTVGKPSFVKRLPRVAFDITNGTRCPTLPDGMLDEDRLVVRGLKWPFKLEIMNSDGTPILNLSLADNTELTISAVHIPEEKSVGPFALLAGHRTWLRCRYLKNINKDNDNEQGDYAVHASRLAAAWERD